MKKSNKMSHSIAVLLMFIMVLALSACGNVQSSDIQSEDTQSGNVQGSNVQENEEQTTDMAESETDENTGTLPFDVSNIIEQADVPLLTLNNGVQMPQLGLGTQIQRLENDASEEGRELLNGTTHDVVVAALQAGYRHLDTD